jgi:methylthioribose-1-phosphate isomerase
VCAGHQVPFYVIAEQTSWVPERSDLATFSAERRSPAEVLRDPPPGVEVLSLRWDRTPRTLVHAYLTEEGLRSPGGAT